MAFLLLKGGTVIIHDIDGHVKGVKTDLLVKDNKISKIQPNIVPPEHSDIIDCSDKLISPGFIDTHHHIWQTQLKGRHANQTLVEFFSSGRYTDSDIKFNE